MKLHHEVATAALLLVLGGMIRAEELYVAGFTTGKLYHIAPDGRNVKAIPVAVDPFDALLSADDAFLYISHPNGNSVTVVHTSNDTLVAAIEVPSSPRKMAIGNNDTRLYVANNTVSAPHVTIIDISPQPGGGRKNAVVDSIDLGSQGAHSAYTVAALGQFLAVGTQSGHVLLYDTSTIPVKFLGKREIGVRVKHIVFSPLGTKFYALLATPGKAIDENGAPTPLGNVHVFRFPSLALKSVLSLGTGELRRATVVKNSYVYVTDARGNLHVIDIGTDTLLSTTNLGNQLSGITANESKVFVADPARNVILTIIPAGHSQKDLLEGPIVLENRAVPVGLVVLRRGPEGKR